MSGEPNSPEDDDALAAEFVLRLLDPESEQAVARRVQADAAFRQRVLRWEADLVHFADDVASEAPPARIKRAVMARVSGGTEERRSRWRPGLSLIAGLAAAFIAVMVVFFPAERIPDGPSAEYAASLSSADDTLQITAAFDPASDVLVVSRSSGAARPGRVLELWLIADANSAPVSLGVLSQATEEVLALAPETAALIPTATLAISEEPPGGSPTGAPTGEVLAAAPVQAL